MHEYKLGEEVERKGLRWLVVRIVEKDSALVVDDQNREYISVETYVMLKSISGEIDFEVLLHEVLPCTTSPNRKIPALPNLWQRRETKEPK